MKFINIFLIKGKLDPMAFFFLFCIVFFITTMLIVPSSALIPADNIPDNQSYVRETNTNTSFDPENYEVFEPEETVTVTPTPIQTSSSSSGSSGGGSGGGGGGVTSSENFNNILQFEQHDGTLIANQPVSFKFNLSVYEILLTGKENEDTIVRVELLKDKPHKATVKPDGEVIQYFNVVTSTKRLKEATIRFKSVSGIKLLKWNNSEWVEVYSNYYPNPDADYVHYIAKTDSFSSFAIVKAEPLTEQTPEPTAISIPIEPAIPIQSPIPKQASGFDVVAFTIVLFIAGLWQRKKKS